MQPARVPLLIHRSAVLLGFALLVSMLFPGGSFAAKVPKKRVAVLGFENKSGFTRGDRETSRLGDAMAEKLVEQLIATGRFVVLEREQLGDVLSEQDLDHRHQTQLRQEARLTTAQALIAGTITDVLETEAGEGGLRFGKTQLADKRRKVVVKANVRLIDAASGQVLSSVTVEGRAEGKGSQVQSNSKNVGVEVKTQLGGALGLAADEVIAKAVREILAGTETIPWQGSLVRVTGSDVVVNAGAEENVEVGMKLRVFEQGEPLIDPDTNETLGSLDEEIGIIEIMRVEARFSVAKAVEGKGFAAGNLVRPVGETR